MGVNGLLTPDRVRALLRRSEAGQVPAITPRMVRLDEAGNPIARPSGPPLGRTGKQAAVLVPLYAVGEKLHIVLTRRTAHLGRHAGQISFPGGAVDPADASYLDAAYREAYEEVGLDPHELELWANLKPVYVSASNYIVHPFVVFARHRPRFHVNANEVAELLEIPLATLLAPGTFTRELRDYQGMRVWEPLFRYGQHRIWGATAVILDQLLWRIEPGLAAPDERERAAPE